jgi:hypothetical protein
VRANLIRVRCCIFRKYAVASLGYPMMVCLCVGGRTTCRREAEDVNANPPCEITGSRALSCVLEKFVVYGTAFGEKVSHDPSTDFFTISLVAMSRQPWHDHQQSNPKFTHIFFFGICFDFGFGFVENQPILHRARRRLKMLASEGGGKIG